MTKWRDVLPVHPAAEMFPLMNADELRELGEDIKKHGLKNPIVLWSERPEHKVFLLDGRNRLDAMEAIGLQAVEIRDDKGGRLKVTNSRQLFGTGEGISLIDGQSVNADPYEYVISANIRRRHLSVEERQHLIIELIARTPEKSNREIARSVGVSPTTIGVARAKGIQLSRIGQLAKTTGKDGKARTTRPMRDRERRAARKAHTAAMVAEWKAALPKTPGTPTASNGHEQHVMEQHVIEQQLVDVKSRIEGLVGHARSCNKVTEVISALRGFIDQLEAWDAKVSRGARKAAEATAEDNIREVEKTTH
jgi:ParB-like chromosome segregation protein Spo0J